MVFLLNRNFSYSFIFPMVFLLNRNFSYSSIFPMVFLLNRNFSYSFIVPMVFLLNRNFSYNFLRFSCWIAIFPVVFLLNRNCSYGFPVKSPFFLWFSHNFSVPSCPSPPPGLAAPSTPALGSAAGAAETVRRSALGSTSLEGLGGWDMVGPKSTGKAYENHRKNGSGLKYPGRPCAPTFC